MSTERRKTNKTARRVIYGVAGFVFLLIAGFVVSLAFSERIFNYALNPGAPFEAFAPPSEPDYELTEAWAALPVTDDYADLVPTGVPPVPSYKRKADVFFIHPTTYLERSGWNASISHPRASAPVDETVMKHQASAFNACCRVYAPRYRQATYYYTIGQNFDSWRALDLAYTDVRRAFDHYVAHWNDGRPFLIAAHGQGSAHALRLLQERIAKTPLRKRFVAAYLPGIGIPLDMFGGELGTIGPCREPDATGCVAGWNTLAEGYTTTRYTDQMIRTPSGRYETNGNRRLLCVNPLSWVQDGGARGHDENLGALPFADGMLKPEQPIPGVTGAECRDGAMVIRTPRIKGFDGLILPGGDYHVYDVNLFWMNLRVNAWERVSKFLASE